MTATFGWMQISLMGVIAAAVGLALLPVSGLAAGQGAVFAVVLLTLVLWTTGAVPPYLASLIFFALTLIFGLATPDLVFAGFASAAVWLIVSGFVIGAADREAGKEEGRHQRQPHARRHHHTHLGRQQCPRRDGTMKQNIRLLRIKKQGAARSRHHHTHHHQGERMQSGAPLK